MSSDNNNHGPEMVIGGLLLALFFFSFIIKVLKQFFIELAESFEAFGNMTGSFIFMLWNVLQVVFLVSMIIASVVAAVYFTIQYWKMVKDGTELQRFVQNSISELEAQTNEKLERFESRINEGIEALDDRLTQALTKPEIAPDIKAQTVDGDSPKPAETEFGDDSIEETDDSEPDEFLEHEDGFDSNERDQQSDTKTEEVTMSNPY